MFWSIISSFVQNKNATIRRITLSGEQSSRWIFLVKTTGLACFFQAPLAAPSISPKTRGSAKDGCTHKQKHKRVKESVWLVRMLQYGKRSSKNKRGDKGANKTVKGEVEHVMLHDITSEFILELPVRSGPNLKEILRHSLFPVITGTSSLLGTALMGTAEKSSERIRVRWKSKVGEKQRTRNRVTITQGRKEDVRKKIIKQAFLFLS